MRTKLGKDDAQGKLRATKAIIRRRGLAPIRWRREKVALVWFGLLTQSWNSDNLFVSVCLSMWTIRLGQLQTNTHTHTQWKLLEAWYPVDVTMVTQASNCEHFSCLLPFLAAAVAVGATDDKQLKQRLTWIRAAFSIPAASPPMHKQQISATNTTTHTGAPCRPIDHCRPKPSPYTL